jgi:3-hydroxyacyl-[acyl-carrier-protein] dehydratase
MNRLKAQIGNSESNISLSGLLALLPYGPGFLFIDEFLEADDTHTVARHRFRQTEVFYSGHFRDRAVTPGVLLLEAMCQGGMVAQGLYLLAEELGIENTTQYRFLVTGAEVEWLEQVRPGDTVIIRSQLSAWRQRRIRTDVKLFCEKGRLLAAAVISGMGVRWLEDALPGGPATKTGRHEVTNSNNCVEEANESRSDPNCFL